MQQQVKYIISAIILLSGTLVFSQNRTVEKDTLDTQVVTVIKSYTPTISDAFKIKERPSLNDETTSAKKAVKYNIFSIPVASTFTPAKGTAAAVEAPKPLRTYDNYASLGFGSYTTILGELYLNHALSRTETVGGYISHQSSQGGLDEVLLNDAYSKTDFNVNYTKQLRDLSWSVDGGFGYQTFNWYGLPQPRFDASTAKTLDVGHAFYNAHAGGKVAFEDAVINNLNLRFRRFGDNQSSGENRLVANAEFLVPISDQDIATNISVDYIGGKFSRNYYTETALNYGNINVGIAPSYQLTQDDLTVNLGVNVVFLNDFETNKNKFYLYPNITASYRLVDEILIAFGGVQGDIIQHSYFEFANQNPSVSPTLQVSPTDQQYNATLGLKGKLSNSVGYHISGGYAADRGKALFKANSVLEGATQDYQNGNSFRVVYDDVKTLSFEGALSVDVNRNFKLGVKANYFNYTTDLQEEAWNLPSIKGSLFADYQIDEHWFTGAGLYFVGKRKDQYYFENTITAVTPQTITLDGYFDANAHVGYKIQDWLSVFLKANNIVGKQYHKWQHYPVQGLQIIGGATYQFDF